ncbi:MAG: DNA polymerase I [Oscillospiraceae bacterium]|jgi:DNA polymerase-1|nr:DNA polymerase I [Oscillospiraceae bacterium]
MKIMLIDGNSLINRAFYGLQPLNAPDGTPTNAVFGFLRILQKLRADHAPDALLVAFDRPEPTFRHALTETYKATRHGMPDDLAVQMPILKDVLDAMNIARTELAGYEADDILGTAARLSESAGHDAVVVTGDRDALQLVSERTSVLLVKTKFGKTETTEYTPERFLDEYGFPPIRLIDLKSLMGDSSDNIKGVAGVGEKTATTLIRDFGSLDGVYADLDAHKGALRAKLEAGRDDAYLSFTLATINAEVPIDVAIDDTVVREPDGARLYELFRRLGFYKMIEQMGLAESAPESAALTMPDGVDPRKIGIFVKDAIRRGENGSEFDVALAAWLANPTARSYDFASLCERYLGQSVDEENAEARDIVMANLRVILDEKLRETGADKLFYDVEMPLCRVLSDMERRGICVDRDALETYGDMLTERIRGAEQAVYDMAGTEFNIGSPKQLGEVLFEKLGLPAPKRTKTGYSTGVDVLDKLEPKYPIITAVKEYRELTKLKSTYADGLLRVVEFDGRIHTSFQMMATATGRLSSTEPNLQNIPVRRALGEQLRHMFVAPEGSLLVDADYSQIELRLLAHIAGDSAMTDAFKAGEDIHAVTAARVFNVPLGEVTKLQRSRAKAVNFGIVYGISAFSLSQDIGVTVAEAREYMESYFERFSGVRAYMTDIVERAKRDGYVETLFGRRRYVPELASSDHNTRAFGERVALNMPIQGTAADIMKIAMVRAYNRLRDSALDAAIILQVHDELIVESPQELAVSVRTALIEEMSGAATLTVPLEVDCGIGRSWADAK